MKRHDYAMPKLLSAQRRRQAILDHLRAHPMSEYDKLVAAALAAEPGTKPNSIRGLVAHMLKREEIAASGAPRQRSYIALVDTTASAEEVRDAYLARKKVSNTKYTAISVECKREKRAEEAARRPEKPQPTDIIGGPGSTVYREGQNPEIRKNQGGQGAASLRSGIGSGMYANPKW